MTKNKSDDFRFPSFEENEKEQILFAVRNTTPAQRLEWLEEMFELFKNYLPDRSKVDG